VRYDDNRFSGFAYQETVSSGLGYQFVKTDDTKLSAQLGGGARRLRPEFLSEDSLGAITATTELPATTDAVLDAAVDQQVRNRRPPPPAGVGSSASLVRLNLVYELKNPKLAPA
jgi:hypothetical protein